LTIAKARHLDVKSKRYNRFATGLPDVRNHDSSFDSFKHSVLIVLGSGGHTSEMFLMLQDGVDGFKSMHRHYLVSNGDTRSITAMEHFETELTSKFSTSGNSYVHLVCRARQVHQSWVSTPRTAITSCAEIFPLLQYLRPDIILTNGPGTGYIAGFVAHLLKMLGLVSSSKLQVLYIESWARVKTLSLSGKFFYHSNIADLMLVQHETVAQLYNLPNAGWMVAPLQ